MDHEVEQLLACYPRIFFACHRRHVRDPKTHRKLSAHQASVLDHLDAVEATSLFELARHMGVTASTMSITADRLVRGGYVSRKRDTADARRIRLRLTKAGLRIKERQSVLEPALVKALLSRLSEQDR